jgi:hypothetical protein
MLSLPAGHEAQRLDAAMRCHIVHPQQTHRLAMSSDVFIAIVRDSMLTGRKTKRYGWRKNRRVSKPLRYRAIKSFLAFGKNIADTPGSSRGFCFYFLVAWHPHMLPVPCRALLRPGIASVPKAEIIPTKAGRHGPGKEVRVTSVGRAEALGHGAEPGAGAPASQAAANVPGRLGLRSHNDAAGSIRNGVTTTSQLQAGDEVHSLTSWLQLCGVQQPGVSERACDMVKGPELRFETCPATRPHETAIQHPSAGREFSRRLHYHAAGSPGYCRVTNIRIRACLVLQWPVRTAHETTWFADDDCNFTETDKACRGLTETFEATRPVSTS